LIRYFFSVSSLRTWTCSLPDKAYLIFNSTFFSKCYFYEFVIKSFKAYFFDATSVISALILGSVDIESFRSSILILIYSSSFYVISFVGASMPIYLSDNCISEVT